VIRVAGVDTYKIYEVLYDKEEAKRMPGLPPRWTHARFLEELVYDFVFPGRSCRKSADSVSMSLSTNDSSMRSFSVFQEEINKENDVYDLRSSSGRKDYCNEVKTKRITKATLDGGYFKHRLDRMRHSSIQARKFDHCQYCYYILMNEIPAKKRKYYQDLRQSRSGVCQCLQCHVNLCLQCDKIFHGADLSAYRSIPM
jgi:hypothetical protein